MYIWVRLCVYNCVYTNNYIHTNVYRPTCIYMYMRICVCLYARVYLYLYIYACMFFLLLSSYKT